MRVQWLGAGPAVVLIHGFPVDARMWMPAARLLASSHRVGLVDLPGFGGTGSGGDTLDAWASTLLGRLRENGVERACVAGCSMGGYVGMAMLRAEPDFIRALALVDSRAAADDDGGKANRDAMVARLEREGASFLPDSITSAPGYLTRQTLSTRPVLVALVREMAASVSTQGAVNAQRAMRARADGIALLRGCGIPLGVIHGDEDTVMPIAGAHALAESLPDCSFTPVHGGAHFAALEQPDVVAAALATLACRP